MATIDIGAAASNRASKIGNGYTVIALDNPANDTGVLTSIEIWMVSSGGVVVATFSGSSTSYTNHDLENLGTVTSDSKQTFTGKNCSVNSGEFIGAYIETSKYIERDTSGGSGVYIKSGNQTEAGTQTYELYSGSIISLYATGTTVAVGNPYHYYLQQ